jgi:hypothetical protein
MPYKSLKQERFFNSPEGRAKLGASVVDEFNAASKGMKLPMRAPKPGGLLGGIKKRKPKFK